MCSILNSRKRLVKREFLIICARSVFKRKCKTSNCFAMLSFRNKYCFFFFLKHIFTSCHFNALSFFFQEKRDKGWRLIRYKQSKLFIWKRILSIHSMRANPKEVGLQADPTERATMKYHHKLKSSCSNSLLLPNPIIMSSSCK